MILNLTIIFLILAGLAMHRYLSNFWEQGQLPYPAGFLFFANIFSLIYSISLVWMFGFVVGMILSILCFFQITYSAGLWIFNLPWLLNVHSKSDAILPPRVNMFVYAAFSYIVVTTAVFMILNFFISPYKSMWVSLKYNYFGFFMWVLTVLIMSNIARKFVMMRIWKNY